ncbi:MAG: emrB 1 [Firmicutes bacterium]|nr:emrB 1 [Bacillota bacterium]
MINIPRLDIPDAKYKWWALGVTIIGGFMSILDTSIVNIALPKMMAVFSVDTTKAEWILTAYMLTMGVLQPITGFLCDTIGTRRIYLLSLAIFTLGSALCGMAWSNNSMIAFRVLQAVGGGVIIPVTMTIVYNSFTLKERNLALGIWGISAMVAPAIGPTLSGYLVEYWDWRLIFTINIPIGIVGYFLAALVLKESDLRQSGKFDYWGLITSAVGLFCLLLALTKGQDEGWTSGYILTLFYLAVANLSLFVVIELSHDNPIVDLSLFKDRNFTLSMLVSFVGTVALYGGIFLMPLFLENLRGYSAMQTGLIMLPSSIAAGITMPLAGRLADRIGAKPLVLLGIIILSVGTLPLMFMDMDTSVTAVQIILVVRGIGMGLFMMPVSVLGMNNVPLSKISRASSVNNVIRQVSGSMGIAVLTTLLQNRLYVNLAYNAEHINIASQASGTIIKYGEQIYVKAGSAAGVAHAKALALVSGIVQQQSYVFAFDDAFYCLVWITFSCLIFAVWLKPVKHDKGGSASHTIME